MYTRPYFLTIRGAVEEPVSDINRQTHKPIREQFEVEGHAVRALYQAVGLAYLAAETGEAALNEQVKALWEDAVNRKMYITGGLGSTHIGEAFSTLYDLPADQAYTETCAGIGLCFFSGGMLALENDARYADAMERGCVRPADCDRTLRCANRRGGVVQPYAAPL